MRPVLLLALLALVVPRGAGADASRLRATTLRRPPAASSAASIAHSQRRRLGVSDWWASLLNALHVPCPAGSSEEHPTGHCAHGSHRGGGGSGGSGGGGGGGGGGSGGGSGGGGGGGGNDDGGGAGADENDDVEGAENEDVDGDDAAAAAGDDAWANDGHDDAAAASDDAAADDAAAASDDAATDDLDMNGDDDLWQNDGWESHNLNASTRGRYARGGGKGWGLAALLGCAVGGLALALTRKRGRPEPGAGRVPRDVYVRDGAGSSADRADASDGGDYEASREGTVEEETVEEPAPGRSRAASIKYAIKRKSSFLRAKLGGRAPAPRADDEGGFVAMAS